MSLSCRSIDVPRQAKLAELKRAEFVGAPISEGNVINSMIFISF